MNKIIKITCSWLIVILIVLVGQYLFRKNSTPVLSEPVKVGAILPLSGFASYYGQESQQGLQIALEDVKKKFPKINLELLYEDSFYAPKGGVDAYSKLSTTHNIDAVIVGGSHIATPIIAPAERDGVLEIAVWSGAPSYSDKHNLNFRTTLLADDQVPPLLKFISNRNLKKLAILYAQNDFGVSFKNTFAQLAPRYGAVITSSEGFANSDSDFRTQLTKVKLDQPDTIFFVGASSQLAAVLKQAHELGLNVQFLSTTIAEDPALIKTAGNLAKGLVYNYSFDSNSLESKKFVDTYKAKYNTIPTFYAAEAYVGLQLLAEALHGCAYKKDVDCWKNYLEKTKGINTIMGPANIDTRGDAKIGKVFLKTIRAGKFVKYE